MPAALTSRDLDELRRRGDDYADDIAHRLAAEADRINEESRSASVGAVAQRDVGLSSTMPTLTILRGALSDRDTTMAGAVREWLAHDVTLPDWVDLELAREGQAAFQRWAMQIGATLYVASLPSAYAAADGVKVLSRASDLANGPVWRRTAETGVMLIKVHEIVDPTTQHNQTMLFSDEAVATLRTVRLVHACLRVDLAGDPKWADEWGVPVNQEDLLGTQLTFSTVVADALGRLGLRLTERERLASLHLWAAVGSLLGITEARRLADPQQAHHLQALIAERHWRPSTEGAALMKSLLDLMDFAMPRGCRQLPRTLVRRAIDPQVADQLAVPAAAWWAPVLGPVAAVGRILTSVPGLRVISGWPMRVAALAIFRMYIDGGLDGSPARFAVTDEQLRRWRVGGGSQWRRNQRLRRLGRRVSRHGTAAIGSAQAGINVARRQRSQSRRRSKAAWWDRTR